MLEPPLLERRDGHGQRQVAAVRIAAYHQMGAAELIQVGARPAHGRRTVLQAGGRGMISERARRVAKLHSHHHQPARGKLVTKTSVPRRAARRNVIPSP